MAAILIRSSPACTYLLWPWSYPSPGRQQQLEEERLDNYVNADHGLYYNHHRSTDPPLEKPGERRQAEMKGLYGDSAPKILAMEAAVQMSFDKYCDEKQPKYWPVIPLKF